MTTPNPDSEAEQRRRNKSDRYFQLSQRFLKHAQEQLERGDTLQASEKVYGALAHAVKAYGELRGWNHYNHYRVGLIIDHLSEEEGDSTIASDFGSVEALHNNFFEYELSIARVRAHINAAKLLTDKLERMRSTPPNPIPSSSLNREQRRRLSQLMQPPTKEQMSVEDLPPLEDLPE